MGFFDRWFGRSDAAAQRKAEKYEKKLALTSGASCRDDNLVHAGWASMRGKRDYNEDTLYCTFECPPDSTSQQQVGCFGVFDGHGGPAAAAYVRENLFKNLLQHEAFETNTPRALEDAYMETDSDYVRRDELAKNDDGCTAVTAVLLGSRLVVAHVGDSRAVLAEDGRGVPLSVDHKPNRDDERDRIESDGGVVAWAGTWRVSGVLAVSRSFGNRQMKTWVISRPDIAQRKLGPQHSALVIATDGVWDVVGNDEAAALVCKHSSAEAAARALVIGAYERGSMDNISAVVVLLRLSEAAAEAEVAAEAAPAEAAPTGA